MEPNVLDQLKSALQELSALLDQPAVRTAIGLIPDAIMSPVIEGLKTILGVVKDALDELKNSLDSVVNIDQLLTTVTSLLDAAAGLAPAQRDTLEAVRAIVRTLQDLPGPADLDEILASINGIVTKLEAL
jgi:phage-related protein